MDRELVLGLLALLILGPAILAAGAIPVASRTDEVSARRLERMLWVRLLVPLLPPLFALAALVGWALKEPEQAESVSTPLVVSAVPFAGIWMRAFVRALRAIWSRGEAVPAGTRGLLRPRAFLSSRLTEALDAEASHAAREHEEAHVRHRDPLRILIAQIVTDLQWPLPVARRRFDVWLEALELARDEEARGRGADGPALASAILTALRMGSSATVEALLTGRGRALRERVDRLLSPLPEGGEAPALARLVPLLLGLLVAGAGTGMAFGESVVRALLS